MAEFKPFQVKMLILTPIVQSGYSISLDGLLYWAVNQLHVTDDVEFIRNELDKLLDKENGIYKASSMFALRNQVQAITQTKVTFPTAIDWENCDIPLKRLDPKGRLKDKKLIETGRGDYRQRITTENAINAQGVMFYGVGDIDKVKFYLNSLFGIGKYASKGCGEISELVVSEIDQDCSWSGEVTGELTLHRHLPKAVFEQYFSKPNQEYLLKKCFTETRNAIPPYKLDLSQAECIENIKPLIVLDNEFIN